MKGCIPCPTDTPIFHGNKCTKCPQNTYFNMTANKC